MKTLYVPGLFTPANFCLRVNRFVARVEIDGEIVTAHVPTSGRLGELLLPGARVMVRKASSQSRKTSWDLMLVKTGDIWVSLDSRLPNYLVGQLLRTDQLPPFIGATEIKAEFTYGASRLDFGFIDALGQQTLVEVKSVTLVEDGIAMFPDAPTIRGTRHLMELTEAIKEGYRAAVLFVIQRDDATRFTANKRTDPAFGEALKRAEQAGVEVYAFRCMVKENSLTLQDQVRHGDGPFVANSTSEP